MTTDLQQATADASAAGAGVVVSRRGLPDVFISFATADRACARLVKTHLEEVYGFRVWWHEDIQCGKEWRIELDRVLGEAACIVVLWSAASLESHWVRHEASQAIALGRYVPAKIEAIDIGRPFEPIQAADLSDWSGKANHPGMISLRQQIAETVPRPRWRRFRHTVGVARSTLVAATVAVVALAGLGWLLTTTVRVNEEQRALLKRQEEGVITLQRQLERVMQPLGDVEATVRLRIGSSSAALRQYSEFIASVLATPVDVARAQASGQVSYVMGAGGLDDAPSVVEIVPWGEPSWHPLHLRSTVAWPISEAVLRTVFRWITARVEIRPKGFPASSRASTAVDGVMWHVTVDDSVSPPEPVPAALLYDVRCKCLYMELRLALAAEASHRGQHSLSVSDVEGGRVSIHIEDLFSGDGSVKADAAEVRAARYDLIPAAVVFRVGGRTFRSLFASGARGARDDVDSLTESDGVIVDMTRSYQPGGPAVDVWERVLLEPGFEAP